MEYLYEWNYDNWIIELKALWQKEDLLIMNNSQGLCCRWPKSPNATKKSKWRRKKQIFENSFERKPWQIEPPFCLYKCSKRRIFSNNTSKLSILLVAGQKPATSIFNSFSEMTWEEGLLLERNTFRCLKHITIVFD